MSSVTPSASQPTAIAVPDQDPADTAAAAPPPPKRSTAAAPVQVADLSSSEEVTAGSARKLHPEVARAQLDKLMSRSLRDPVVSDADVNRAIETLSRVPPRELPALLGKLERSGALPRLVSEAPPQAREDLLALLDASGYLKLHPGSDPPGPLYPPSGPSVYWGPTDMPASLVRLTAEHTQEQWSRYEKEFKAYEGRYAEAVKQAASAAELRRLGPPADPFTQGRHITNSSAYLALADRTAQLQDRQRAGTMAFGLTATGEVGPGKLTSGVRSDSRGASTSLEPGLELKDKYELPGVKAEWGFDIGKGSREVGAKVEVGTGAAKVGGGVALGSNGTLELQAIVGLWTSKVEVDPVDGRARLSVCASTPFSGALKGKLCTYFEAQGMTREVAMAAVDRTASLFEAPPELARGVPWGELAPDRRHVFEVQGWTEAEWMATLPVRPKAAAERG